MVFEEVIKKLALYLAPVSEKVSNPVCRSQSIAYINSLKEGTSWAAKMWDATAKIQAGLFTGNFNSLGNYDECLNVMEIQSETGSFSGKYCLASISFANMTTFDDIGKLLYDVIEEEEEINIGLGALLSKGLRWGYCIPSSCTAQDLSVGLSEYFRKMPAIKINVDDDDCRTHQEESFSTTDWIAVAVTLLLLTCVLLSTGYEFVKEYMKKTKFYKETTRTAPSQPTRLENPNPQNPPAERPRTLCLPEGETEPKTETTEEEALQAVQRVRQVQRKPDETADIHSDPEEQNPPPQPPQSESDRIAERRKILTLVSAGIDSPLRAPSQSEKDILNSFSLISNWRSIFFFNESSKLLTSVDGIKFLSLCWIVLAHASFVTVTLPAINYISIFQNLNKWPSVLLLNTQLAIDTFLVCTGVLISYNYFNDMRDRGIQQWEISGRVSSLMNSKFMRRYLPIYFIHRYIRLIPALAFMVLMQVSLLKHAGSGPFWGTGSGYLSNVCHESWWGTLLLVQNYISGDKICLPHSWYVMVDYQLYLISPVILLMFLYLRPWKSMIVAGFLVALGIISTFIINFYFDLPAAMFKGGAAKWHLKSKYEYVTVYTRFAPWMIGMTVGFLLHRRRTKEREEPILSRLLVCLGWVFALICLSCATFGLIPFQKEYDYSNPIGRALYSSVYHTLWALGVGWIIFACETKHGGLVHEALSRKIFQPLRRLTYCTYLVHLPLMTHRALLTRVPIHMNQAAGISSFFGDLLFSLQFALVLTMLVELPFMRMFKAFTLSFDVAMRCVPPDYEKRLSEYAEVWKSLANYYQTVKGRYKKIDEEKPAEEEDTPDVPAVRYVATAPGSTQTTEGSELASSTMQTSETSETVPGPSASTIFEPRPTAVGSTDSTKQSAQPPVVSEPTAVSSPGSVDPSTQSSGSSEPKFISRETEIASSSKTDPKESVENLSTKAEVYAKNTAKPATQVVAPDSQ